MNSSSDRNSNSLLVSPQREVLFGWTVALFLDILLTLSVVGGRRRYFTNSWRVLDLMTVVIALASLVLAYLVTRWACGRLLRELIALHDEGQAHATATSTRDAARREAKRI